VHVSIEKLNPLRLTWSPEPKARLWPFATQISCGFIYVRVPNPENPQQNQNHHQLRLRRRDNRMLTRSVPTPTPDSDELTQTELRCLVLRYSSASVGGFQRASQSSSWEQICINSWNRLGLGVTTQPSPDIGRRSSRRKMAIFARMSPELRRLRSPPPAAISGDQGTSQDFGFTTSTTKWKSGLTWRRLSGVETDPIRGVGINFGKCPIYRGDSAEISAESLGILCVTAAK
ncbi:xyloglucan xylosyltransferase 5, partial [Prunus dulcis]